MAIKRVDKGSIDIHDRDILLEIKQVRELSHENVNGFVGACVDAPNVCVLMLYASKGSLQDALQNDHINLSWDFKISFATDIAKVIQNLFYVHKQSWCNENCFVFVYFTFTIIVAGYAIPAQQPNQIPRETDIS